MHVCMHPVFSNSQNIPYGDMEGKKKKKSEIVIHVDKHKRLRI